MWHKVKTLVKRLREAVRATKTVKPSVVGACEHVREVRCFTKKELEAWLETKGVRVPGAATKKKDELMKIVWGVLFPNEAGKPLEDNIVEIDALEGLHWNAAEEAKEWLYGACQMRERVRDDNEDMLASHVQHLTDHWAGDHSMCGKELSNLCKPAGGSERESLYEAGGRVHAAVSRCLQQFASNTKMAYYTRARMTFNNECFHSVINKYCTKRLNFPKLYEARVCCTTLEWNKNKRIRPSHTTFHKPTNVTHRRRSVRRHVYPGRDTSWRFDIAIEVIGSPRVGDWARNMLHQSDVDDPIVEHVVVDADFGLLVAGECVPRGDEGQGADILFESTSDDDSDDEKSPSDSGCEGAAQRLDFDGVVLSHEVSVVRE
ncbi:hypothetical protein CBR_g50930 [Chara braunii]|uniref:Uncharacterized protein n=1 Tax=Chara braunii TaxID=69332 RepID=A0A388M7L7_CHABU|nr:hypothetical protein CBR_g50930 [Chara braunii]|eukprot:GBG90587.1 hypothetical protein CBR_g50930 [Chara braunii]